MKQKILTIMFASVMAMLAFTAYSNDDEPQYSTTPFFTPINQSGQEFDDIGEHIGANC